MTSAAPDSICVDNSGRRPQYVDYHDRAPAEFLEGYQNGKCIYVKDLCIFHGRKRLG